MKDPRVVETIRSKNISDDVKKKAIKEARLIAKQNLASFQNVQNIGAFAYWTDTPSGHDFWRKIDMAKRQTELIKIR